MRRKKRALVKKKAKATSSAGGALEVRLADSAGPQAEECMICREDAKLWGTWSSCGHSVCWLCAVRLAVMRKEHVCCFCRTGSEVVTIGARGQAPGSKPQWFVGAAKVQYADAAARGKVSALFDQTCAVCRKAFRTYAGLAAHMRRQHAVAPCDLCAENKLLFPKERVLFTPADLLSHLLPKSPGAPHAHPICYFCSALFCDSDALQSHVLARHVTCWLCAHAECVYFFDADSFWQHCRRRHAVCEACYLFAFDDRCAAYPSPAALRAHVKECPNRANLKTVRALGVFPPADHERPPGLRSAGLRVLDGPSGCTMEKPKHWDSASLLRNGVSFSMLHWAIR